MPVANLAPNFADIVQAAGRVGRKTNTIGFLFYYNAESYSMVRYLPNKLITTDKNFEASFEGLSKPRTHAAPRQLGTTRPAFKVHRPGK